MEEDVLMALGNSRASLSTARFELSLVNLTVWPIKFYDSPNCQSLLAVATKFAMSVKSSEMEGAYFQDPHREFWEIFPTRIISSLNKSDLTALRITSDLICDPTSFPDLQFGGLKELSLTGVSFDGLLVDFITRHHSTLSKLKINGCSYIIHDDERDGGWAEIWTTLSHEMTSLTELVTELTQEDSMNGYAYCDDGWGYITMDEDSDTEEWLEEDTAALEQLLSQVYANRLRVAA